MPMVAPPDRAVATPLDRVLRAASRGPGRSASGRRTAISALPGRRASSSSACAMPSRSRARPASIRASSRARLGLLHQPHPAGGHRAARVLGHHQVPVGERGHLRQVGHHQHLVGAGQPGQPAADLHRRLAADAGVDLVEDQRGRGRRRRRTPPRWRASPGTARRRRRPSCSGSDGAPGVRPAAAAPPRRPRAADRRPCGRRRRGRLAARPARGHRDSTPGVRHGQPGQLDADRARRTGRPPPAGRADDRPASSATSTASRWPAPAPAARAGCRRCPARPAGCGRARPRRSPRRRRRRTCGSAPRSAARRS